MGLHAKDVLRKTISELEKKVNEKEFDKKEVNKKITKKKEK